MDNLYRGLVVASRLPAITIVVSQLARIPFLNVAVPFDQHLLLFTMLACYGLWAVADIMLIQGTFCRVFSRI